MLRPSKLIAALALATAVTTLAGCGEKSPEERIKIASEALKASDYKTATIELKSALQQSPANLEARMLLGQALLDQGQWADSEKEFRKALEIGASPEKILPKMAHVLVKQKKHQDVLAMEIPKVGLGSQAFAAMQGERANALLGLNKPIEAEHAIKEGEKTLGNLRPEDISPELQLAKARLAYYNKRPSEALSLINAILSNNSTFSEALYMKGYLLIEAGDSKSRDEATKVYQQLVAIDPMLPFPHISLADIHLKSGHLDEADKAIMAAEKVAPKQPMVLFLRATLQLRRGKFKEADDTILEVLKTLPQHPPSLLISAATNYGLGHYEKSRKHAGIVLAQSPDNEDAAKFLAASQLKLNDIPGVLTTLAPFIQRNTNNATLFALAGEAYLRLDDYTRAMEHLDRAAKLDPSSSLIKTRQASGYYALGQGDQAIAKLEQASQITDQPGQADIVLILLSLNNLDYDKALRSINDFEKKLPNNPITHNLRAKAYLGKKDTISAIRSLEKALAIDPKFYPAVANLATLDIQNNNPTAARKRIENFLEKDKDNIQAMLTLAKLASTSGQTEIKVTWLEKAAKAHPTALEPRAELIKHHLSRNDKQQAIAIAKAATSATNESPSALSLLGGTQLITGDLKGAITSFSRLTEKAKDSPDAFLQLGMAQFQDKRYTAARSTLQYAVQLQPDHLAAQDALLRLNLYENKPEAALQIAKRLQAQKGNIAIGFDREGEILLSLKRGPQAIKAYEQALSHGAGNATLTRLHRALIQTGDTKGAEQRLRSWLHAHPDDQDTRNYAAGYYLSENRNREAATLYEEVLRASPMNVVAMNNLANLYLIEKDKRALTLAQNALQLAPNSAIVQDTLGWILLDQRQFPRALELISAARKQLPENASIHYHYGVALARSGKAAEARKEIEALVASGQKFPELDQARALLKSL